MLCTQHCTRIRWAELLGKYWGGQDRKDSWLMEKLYRPVCLSWGVLLSFFECGLHLLSAPGWGLSAVPLNRSVCSVFLWLLFSRLLSYSVKMRAGLVWDEAMPALNKSYAVLYPIRMSLKEHLWGWCLCSVRVSVLKRSTKDQDSLPRHQCASIRLNTAHEYRCFQRMFARVLFGVGPVIKLTCEQYIYICSCHVEHPRVINKLPIPFSF